ncbi:MAG: endo-1,4-beta-xylanase, partial [Solobacterium sp.]|nr:endo-1,4-beta-xylanase [Solobacterium sp.]
KIIRLLRDTVLNPDHLIQSDAINPDGNGTLLGDGLVDGIGMQGHIDTSTDVSRFMSAMKAYNELTGLVHVTELDVANPKYPDSEEPALLYHELFQAFVDAVKSGIGLESVTVWGLKDDRAYKREKHISLLFDEKLQPKKEFYAVVEAAKDDHR